jgi:hypothetical protein
LKQLFPQTVHSYHDKKRAGETGLSWGTLMLVDGTGTFMGRSSNSRIFWPLLLAGSEPNRRMTDAAHNQHSETRRPSDRDAPSVPRF